MDELPTLQKARQYYQNQAASRSRSIGNNQNQNSQLQSTGVGDKLEKIKKYLTRYDAVKNEVWNKINGAIDVQQNQQDQIDIFADSNKTKSIVENSQIPNPQHGLQGGLLYSQTQTQSVNGQKYQNQKNARFLKNQTYTKQPNKLQYDSYNNNYQNTYESQDEQQEQASRQPSYEKYKNKSSTNLQLNDRNKKLYDQQNLLKKETKTQYQRMIQQLEEEDDQLLLQKYQTEKKGINQKFKSQQKLEYVRQIQVQEFNYPLRQFTQTQLVNGDRTQSVVGNYEGEQGQRDGSMEERQGRYLKKTRIVAIPQPKNIFQQSMVDSSIVEICGAKGVGKTALLLHFCQKFAQTSNKTIYFVNCASGITQKRFQRLSKNCPYLQYRDSYILQHVLAVCKSALNDPQVGCIAVDSLTNLLMQEQKTLIFLIKLFKIFSSLLHRPGGCKIVLSNYIQQWFQNRQEEFLTNHYSYYSSVTSEFLKYKYFLKKWPKSDQVLIKMIRGGFIEGMYTVGSDGVETIEINDGKENKKSK